MRLSLIENSKKFIALICILMIVYLGYKLYRINFIEITIDNGTRVKFSIKTYPTVKVNCQKKEGEK